jgi:hypothetical protein
LPQIDTANAQAATLDEWADQWERDHALEGSSEVSFLMRRASRMIRRCTGQKVEEPVGVDLVEADAVDQPRP